MFDNLCLARWRDDNILNDENHLNKWRDDLADLSITDLTLLLSLPKL